LGDAARILRRRDFFLWRRDDEVEPQDLNLSFKPVVAEKVIHRAYDKNACVLCARRISYKKNQFGGSPPASPYLILIHNDFLGPRAGYFNKPEETALFEKMIEAVWKISPADLLVREILRCHFSAEDTLEPANLARCETHLRDDLNQLGIRGILLMGKAAALLYPKKEDLEAKQNLVFEWQGLPTMICSGPNRLQFMREKGMAKDQIDAERQKIFASLTMFRDKIIRAAS